MRRLKKLFLILTCAAFLQGCMMDCIPADIDLTVISFTDTELDNVEISKYTKGSNFSLKIETAILIRGSQHYQRNTDTVILPNVNFPSGDQMTSGYDYEINILKAGKIFRITEIIEEQRSEKKDSKVACINPVISYKVNNRLVTGVNWDPFYLKK